MLDLGLDRADELAYLRALKDSHQVRITVGIANRNEVITESLSVPQSMVLDGSVQVDVSGPVTRSLSLTIVDEQHKLSFTPDSPAQGTLYADRFVSVHHGIYVEELAEWVDVPVFFGPLTSLAQAGPVLSLEAQGKESLLLDPHFAVHGYTVVPHGHPGMGYSINKGERLDDAIKKVARHAGEQRFSIPRLTNRLYRTRSVSAQSEPWLVITGGEQDANGHRIAGLVEIGKVERHALYDGRGRLVVRRVAKNPIYTFTTAIMTEQPQVTFAMLDFRNYAHVTGRRPKGAKRHVSGKAGLPKHNSLSAQSLGRNGVPRYLAEFAETELKTDGDCREKAQKMLDARARSGIEATFNCLPVPHLEELDVIRVRTDDYQIEFPLRQFTIPLTADPMTVGANKRVSARKRRRRHHGVHGHSGGYQRGGHHGHGHGHHRRRHG